jgi:hypothetical protein
MNTKTQLIRATIAELDQKHNDVISNQETATGTNLEVRNTVGQRMTEQRQYEIDRKNLVGMLNDATPLSKGVEDFLIPKITEGKMDVLAGNTKIDTSLETEGKQVGKQI